VDANRAKKKKTHRVINQTQPAHPRAENVYKAENIPLFFAGIML